MKKLELLSVLLFVTSVSIAQARGRGDNQNIQSNNNKQVNVQQTSYALNNYSNVGNLNNNFVFDNVGNPAQSNINYNLNRGGVGANEINGINDRLVQRRNEVNVAMVQENSYGNTGNLETVIYEQNSINVTISNLVNNVLVSNEFDNSDEIQNVNIDKNLQFSEMSVSENNVNDVVINYEFNVPQVQLKMPEINIEKNSVDREDVNPTANRVNFDLSFNLPQIKKENIRTNKVKRPKNFGYRQHQSITEMIKNKSKVIKKILENKSPKKVVCSVVCYTF